MYGWRIVGGAFFQSAVWTNAYGLFADAAMYVLALNNLPGMSAIWAVLGTNDIDVEVNGFDQGYLVLNLLTEFSDRGNLYKRGHKDTRCNGNRWTVSENSHRFK